MESSDIEYLMTLVLSILFLLVLIVGFGALGGWVGSWMGLSRSWCGALGGLFVSMMWMWFEYKYSKEGQTNLNG